MLNEWRNFIDTNILIYAEDMEVTHKHDVAFSLISQLAYANNGFISNQILAEFSNQMVGFMSTTNINQRISDYRDSFNLLFYTIDDIQFANQIFETHKIHFFDALIAATMKNNNIDTIVTENERDFKKIPWIKVINPFK